MARVKKTSRAAPVGSHRGLAGVPRLDTAFPQPYPNQHNLHHLTQSFWVPPDPSDPEFNTMRDFDTMPPPPPPAAQDVENEVLEGNFDQVLERTATAGEDALTQPPPKKRKIADAGPKYAELERNLVSQPSRSSTNTQIRISALESTLRILQDKKKELEGGLAMMKRAPDAGKGRVAAEPETKARPQHVTFVNYDAKQKARMGRVQKRMKTSKKEFEVAKKEDDAEEMTRLTDRLEWFERVLGGFKEHAAEREAASEEEADDDDDE